MSIPIYTNFTNFISILSIEEKTIIDFIDWNDITIINSLFQKPHLINCNYVNPCLKTKINKQS